MFRKKTQLTLPLPSEPVAYPVGTFLKTEKGYFYIAKPDARYRIISKRVLDSWSPHRVAQTTEAAVSRFRVIARMKFRNGSLIWDLSDAKVYLVEGGKRRHITNPDWFRNLGATQADLVQVSKEETELHELGEVLD